MCVVIFVRFNSAPYFQMKKLFYIYFFIVFLIMLENPELPSWKFSSPMTNYSMESSPNISSSSQQLPPPDQKNQSENVCTLPNNHYYM